MSEESQKTFVLMSKFDGARWLPDLVVEGTPIPEVRKALGGRWRYSRQFTDYAACFFGELNRRVLILKFPVGTTREQADSKLQEINEASQELS